MTSLREARTEVVDALQVHSGPHECAVTACEDPWCGARRGACCEHCPAEYRRRQALEALPGQRGKR